MCKQAIVCTAYPFKIYCSGKSFNKNYQDKDKKHILPLLYMVVDMCSRIYYENYYDKGIILRKLLVVSSHVGKDKVLVPHYSMHVTSV